MTFPITPGAIALEATLGLLQRGGFSNLAPSASVSERGQSPAVTYGGRQPAEVPGYSQATAIQSIARNWEAVRPGALTAQFGQPSGDVMASFQDALGRSQAAGVSHGITIDSIAFDAGKAVYLGDDNLKIVTDRMNEYNPSPTEARARIGELMRRAAMQPDAPEQVRAEYEAFMNGTLKMVPLEELGIERKVTVTTHFNADGVYLGGGSRVETKGLREYHQQHIVRQEDGSRIDPETGQWTNYIATGAVAYITFLDRPAG
ncbi:hypothetical protein [Parvularcula oceani]|uniref:hypothetical protein n=1 Tax=Parvularcula oceani TaxID=1247963 RepID=UPI0004E1A74B|nr:hypothetical protein [Parvularcula oceani]